MGFEITVILLSIALIALPVLAWAILRKLSVADKQQKKLAEMNALENSLSLMVKELQESVQQALVDMEDAADTLNQLIDKADDRIRQLQYYEEYGDELRPIIPSQSNDVHRPAGTQGQALKHKEVHELSRKGWSAAQIARHTGMSTDEVQLIVNLMEISILDSPSESRQLIKPEETNPLQQPFEPPHFRQPMV